MYWNPGGLANVKEHGLSAMYSKWVADLNFNSVSYAFPIPAVNKHNIATMAVGIASLSQGNLEGRDNNRQITGTFGASDLAVTVGYGRKADIYNRNFNIGFNTKLIYQQIESESATGIAFDIGLQTHLFTPKLLTGISIQNLGQEMKFVNTRYNLPLNANVGFGYVFDSTILSVDFKRRLYEGDNTVSFGTEFSPIKALSLRLGYQAPSFSKNLQMDSPIGFSLGIGLNILNATLNYAFVPYGAFGDTQRIDVSIRF
ncbi:MAG: hypothetical protein A2297_06580 [Elusimicrobia bacterium RIFOXYB2_FULL_48_7]|nr:MAG: hypothetical protein A2297_06580 [Elusimicrobia bacterium RIFOXYB2_FULL_48_7]